MKKNKKNKKKIILLLIAFLIIILLFYTSIKIYALFYSELSGNVKIENGKWNILVNDVDITNGTNISLDIDKINMDENEHIKPGNFAPGFTRKFQNLYYTCKYRCFCKI